MAVLGRILQILGWLWVAFGVFGPLLDLPNISWFPGLILVFLSRIVRTQVARRSRAEEQDDTPIPNVERPPDPPKTQSRPAPAAPQPTPVVVEPSRQEIEQVLLDSMREKADVPDPVVVDQLSSHVDDVERPKTSAEMIAEARQRWNKRP